MNEPKSIKLGKHRITQMPGARTLYVHDETILEMNLKQIRSLQGRPLTDAELMVLMFEEIVRLRALVPKTDAEVYGQIAENHWRDRNKVGQADACADGCQLAKDYGFSPSEGHSCAQECAYEKLQHDNLRDNIGQAISDSLARDAFDPENFPGLDIFDSRNIDEIADAVMAVLQKCMTQPVAYRWWESKWGEFKYEEERNPHRMSEPLYLASLPVTKEEPFAWYIDGPQGSCSTVYKQHAIEPTITWLASKDGFERDDYTVTALYLGAKP